MTTEALDLAELEQQTETLIRLCDRFKQENAQLRQRNLMLEQQVQQIQERNQQAASRVAHILDRLKTMDGQDA